MEEKIINLGIIGCGGRGVYFGGKGFMKESGFRLTAVCDIDPEKARAAAEVLEGDITPYTDVDEFLKHPELDAVIVASPDRTHADIAVKVLKAKKHLYLEKPMAQTIADCDRIIEAWKGSGVVFMVGLELRFCSLMQETKKIIQSGEIGRIIIGTVVDNVSVGGNYYYHNAKRRREYIKSLVLEKGTHSLDLANWLIDDTPYRVYASGALDVYGGNEPNDKHCADCDKASSCPFFINTKKGFQMDYNAIIRRPSDLCVYAKECDTPDNSLVLIDYKHGARLSYMECHFTPEYTREFTFVGDKGKLIAFYDNEQNFKITVWKRFEKEPVYYYPPKIAGGHGGGDPGIIHEFADRVRIGKPCIPGVKGARDSAAIAIASYLSEASGHPEFIPDVDYGAEIE